MLRIRNLEAGYGKLRVLKNISMHVNAGEIVAIIGANGAGKTTLLVHHRRADPRHFRRDPFPGPGDHQPAGRTKSPARGCVMVPEGRQVFASMTVEENLLLGGHALRQKDKNELDRPA